MGVNKTFSILGDSISTFEGMVPPENHVYYQGEVLRETGVLNVHDTWWMQVIDRCRGKLLSNASFSGSLVEGVGFPAACSDARVAQLAGPCGEAPDVVLVFMGINDFGWGGARAQAAGRSKAVPLCLDLASVPEKMAQSASPDALETFAKSYGVMLQKVRRAYPQAAVWCMTLLPGRELGKHAPAFTYALRGVELDSYNDAIKQAAQREGCQVADIRALGFDYEASDGTHPTKRGMQQIAAMVCACLENAGSKPTRSDACSENVHSCDVNTSVGDAGTSQVALPDQAKQAFSAGLFPESMRSQRWCNEPSCIDCPHARATGNQWSCVCDKPV